MHLRLQHPSSHREYFPPCPTSLCERTQYLRPVTHLRTGTLSSHCRQLSVVKERERVLQWKEWTLIGSYRECWGRRTLNKGRHRTRWPRARQRNKSSLMHLLVFLPLLLPPCRLPELQTVFEQVAPRAESRLALFFVFVFAFRIV